MEAEKIKKAVCLKYPENAEAPFIAAKGRGVVAERIEEIARQNHIPVVEDLNLANVLYMEDAGELIPEELYEALAKIFAFVVQAEKKL